VPAVQKVRESARTVQTHPHLVALSTRMLNFADHATDILRAVEGTAADIDPKADFSRSIGDLVPAVRSALIGLLKEADDLEADFQRALQQSPMPACPPKSARRS